MTQTLICKNVTYHNTRKGIPTQSGSETSKQVPENRRRLDFRVFRLISQSRNTTSAVTDLGFSRRWGQGCVGGMRCQPQRWRRHFAPKVDLFVACKEIPNSFETQTRSQKNSQIKKVQYLQRTFPLKKDPIVNALCQCMLWVVCDAFVIAIVQCERTLNRPQVAVQESSPCMYGQLCYIYTLRKLNSTL